MDNRLLPTHASNNPMNNIVTFPTQSYSTATSRKVSGHMTKTVHPIKDLSQIHALHRNLLSKAENAPTPSKARIAWRNWLFFALGINLGFRGGDITELTWGKLVTYCPDTNTYSVRHDEYNFIHAEKTGKATYVYLNAEAERVIHAYLAATIPLGIRPYADTPVFPSNKRSGTSESTVSGHIDCDNIGRILKKAAKEVGITQSICTHSLRKTFGYLHYKETGDIITLQKIFGHSSPAITLTYIGIDTEELQNAYAAKPDTCIPDLEMYIPDREKYIPDAKIDISSPKNTTPTPSSHPANLRLLKTSPLLQYSPDRYTPQISHQRVRALP